MVPFDKNVKTIIRHSQNYTLLSHKWDNQLSADNCSYRSVFSYSCNIIGETLFQTNNSTLIYLSVTVIGTGYTNEFLSKMNKVWLRKTKMKFQRIASAVESFN